MWRKDNSGAQLSGMQNGAAAVENSTEFLTKLKTELPYDAAISLLSIYLGKKMKTLFQKDTDTPMFTATLFTRAKLWEQPKCALKDERIKKLWYRYV